MAVANPAAGDGAGTGPQDEQSGALATRDGGVVTGIRAAARTVTLGAPIHPILVHYTIALTSASLLFEILGRVFHVPSLASTGWWTLALGVVATVGTLVTGVASRMGLEIGEGEARSYLRLHMALGPMFFGMLLATALWRAHLWYEGREVGWWYLTVLAATAGIMLVQGYAGGELVYRWGADVEGRHRGLRQQQGTASRPRLPSSAARRPDAEAGRA